MIHIIQCGIRTILLQNVKLGYRFVLGLVYGLGYWLGLGFWLEYGLGHGLRLVAI